MFHVTLNDTVVRDGFASHWGAVEYLRRRTGLYAYAAIHDAGYAVNYR